MNTDSFIGFADSQARTNSFPYIGVETNLASQGDDNGSLIWYIFGSGNRYRRGNPLWLPSSVMSPMQGYF
ncbi:MAG: hypothetical protein WC155_11330 [Candidatus Cloacimonadales bacterium]